MHRLLSLTAFALLLILAASLAPPRSLHADEFPPVIQLPSGWLPEGVVMGNGSTLYAGSRRHGGIYAVNVETGLGHVLYPGREGRVATGLEFDARTGYIFASGANTGDLHVYDSETGENVASYKLAATPGPTFINDVTLMASAVYATDSMRPVLYRIPLGAEGGLPPAGAVQVINLTGDYVHQAGFNVNGIEATPFGDRLIIVQTNTGYLFEVSPFTGRATRISIGEAGGFGQSTAVTGGDGLYVTGKILYVVRGGANQVVKIRLDFNSLSGAIVARLTHAGFDTPTTLTKSGDKLYVVNGRFTAGTAPNVPYSVVTLDHWVAPGED